MRITWHTFRQALKVANPKLVLGPSINAFGAMVFMRSPGHEDCAPGTTLVEVMAIASPAFFRQGPPCLDVAMDIEGGKRQWVRGYGAFFRKLCKMRMNGRRIADKKALERFLPAAFTRFNSQGFKQDVIAANRVPKTDLQRKSEWLKGRSKPIPGYGMPLDWAPTKIITGGGAASHATPAGMY